MNDKNKRVAVVGAGIVGCSCALWLQKKGFEVTLIDPEEPGSGTSSGNACVIADYACVPVNDPSIFKRLPWLMFSKDSPLSVDLGYAVTHPRWMFSFLSNCKVEKVARITRILGKLLAKAYEGMEPLLEMANAKDLIEQRGALYLYHSEQEFIAAQASNQSRRDAGASYVELGAAEIKDLEPNIKIDFERGLFFDKASPVANPRTLVQRYFDCFKRNGGHYVRSRALAVEHQVNSVSLLLGDGQKLSFDKIVIAAGAFSTQIKGIRGQALPLDTERGYHVQYNGYQDLLKRPVSWGTVGCYASPMDEGLRIAGTVEIAGYSAQKNSRNIDYLVRRGHELLDLPPEPDQTWLGFRPTFPDALPVIGYSLNSDYILFAFGHQHIGLTLAGITGKLIAQLANTEKPSHEIKPFSPKRFL